MPEWPARPEREGTIYRKTREREEEVGVNFVRRGKKVGKIGV